MSNRIDNIPPEKRGNPAWVKGGASPNPGGRPKKLTEIEKMLDEEFRGVEKMREVYAKLRELAIEGTEKGIYHEGVLVATERVFAVGYMELLLNRLQGPVKDLDVDLSDAPAEALAYLREKLRQ